MRKLLVSIGLFVVPGKQASSKHLYIHIKYTHTHIYIYACACLACALLGVATAHQRVGVFVLGGRKEKMRVCVCVCKGEEIAKRWGRIIRRKEREEEQKKTLTSTHTHTHTQSKGHKLLSSDFFVSFWFGWLVGCWSLCFVSCVCGGRAYIQKLEQHN